MSIYVEKIIAAYAGGLGGLCIILMHRRTTLAIEKPNALWAQELQSIDETLAVVTAVITEDGKSSSQNGKELDATKIVCWYLEGARSTLVIPTLTAEDRKFIHRLAVALDISSRRMPMTEYRGACCIGYDEEDGEYRRECRHGCLHSCRDLYDKCKCPKYITTFPNVELAPKGQHLKLTGKNTRRRHKKGIPAGTFAQETARANIESTWGKRRAKKAGARLSALIHTTLSKGAESVREMIAN